MNQTGHRSVQMVRRYIRDGSLFRDNSAGGETGAVKAVPAPDKARGHTITASASMFTRPWKALGTSFAPPGRLV
jgi:hypothetical protein